MTDKPKQLLPPKGFWQKFWAFMDAADKTCKRIRKFGNAMMKQGLLMMVGIGVIVIVLFLIL